MQPRPLRTTVIGSYPFPAWLEFASQHLDQLGSADVAELVDDAVVCAIHDQVTAGLDVITDGEQTRLDFNLSFYGYLDGIDREQRSPRLWGPPAHDQRGKHAITGALAAPRGLGVVDEFRRLQRLAPPGPTLKASIPGPYTLSGRLQPNAVYPDRYAVTEALLPLVRAEARGAGRRRLPGDHGGRALHVLLCLQGGHRPAGGHLQPHGCARRGQVPPLDAPLLRQLSRRAPWGRGAMHPCSPRSSPCRWTRSTWRWPAASSPSSRSSARSPR